MNKNPQSTYNKLLYSSGKINDTVVRILNKLQYSIVTCEEVSVRRYNKKYLKP